MPADRGAVKWLLGLVAVVALAGCGEPGDTPTTERYKTMVKACERIHNEHDRSTCLQHVPAKP